MPRARHEDTPEYAVNVVDRARSVGSHVAAAAGLFAVLLVAMSAVETPMPLQGLSAEATMKREGSPTYGSEMLCSIGEKFRNWVGVQDS